jgi:hypothetical protein
MKTRKGVARRKWIGDLRIHGVSADSVAFHSGDRGDGMKYSADGSGPNTSISSSSLATAGRWREKKWNL